MLLLLLLLLFCGYCVVGNVDVVGDVDDYVVVRDVAVFAAAAEIMKFAAAEIMKLWTVYIRSISS